MYKFLFLFACLSAAISITLGAMAAHGLKPKISPEQLENFKTAAYYQMVHALAIFFICLAKEKLTEPLANYAGIGFITGTVLFSGSIYLLSCKDLLGIQNTKILGPITPIGGLLFIISWILLAAAGFRKF